MLCCGAGGSGLVGGECGTGGKQPDKPRTCVGLVRSVGRRIGPPVAQRTLIDLLRAGLDEFW